MHSGVLLFPAQVPGANFSQNFYLCFKERPQDWRIMNHSLLQRQADGSTTMKSLLLAISVLLVSTPAAVQSTEKNFDLPELHKIHKITLSPSYSCRSDEDFHQGYGTTVLYLSKNSRGPELEFNGACGSQDHLVVNMTGGDMNLIADMGKVLLEDLSADQPFVLRLDHSLEPALQFKFEAQIEVGHTYAVLVNKTFERALFYFTVTGHLQNKRLDLRYAVKDFQLTTTMMAEAPGFSWERKSTE
jgi:hypothetical protein